jgi:hypothetical protein
MANDENISRKDAKIAKKEGGAAALGGSLDPLVPQLLLGNADWGRSCASPMVRGALQNAPPRAAVLHKKLFMVYGCADRSRRDG